MSPHDTILSQGSMAILKELRRALELGGLESSIVGPPGGNPNK